MKKPLSISVEQGTVLALDKPLQWTSADVVRKIKFALQRAGHRKPKVGHAGTLDPLATGVLLVCIGPATKRVEELQAGEKEYIAEFTLGATTPSYDLEHEIDARYAWEHITREDLEAALDRLSGEVMQVPPLYSAKMVEGRRAYEIAREGGEVELRQVPVTIRQTEVVHFEAPVAVVRIACSKGTYIRSIARDLGVELDSGAHLSGLCRTRSGDHSLADCYSVEEVIDYLQGGEK